MSEAFFRSNNMLVSKDAPAEFKTDLDLWRPVPPPAAPPPVDQEPSPEEIESQRQHAENKRRNDSKPKPTKPSSYGSGGKTKRRLGYISDDDEASSAAPPPQPSFVDLTDSPPTSPTHKSDPQPKKPRLDVGDDEMEEEDETEKKRKAAQRMDDFLNGPDKDQDGLTDAEWERLYNTTLYISALLQQLKIYAAE
jgi:hypothetical protein